jgi:L-aminopeptidase/D-esterase-like protein
LSLPDGVKVLAYAAVNSLGDVRDASQNIIAGAKLPDGVFADCTQYLLSGQDNTTITPLNTTLVAVFTNALFEKAEKPELE